ncbi:MAG: hypothetical protein R2854_19350 [Caldilineaceae bacterium]
MDTLLRAMTPAWSTRLAAAHQPWRGRLRLVVDGHAVVLCLHRHGRHPRGGYARRGDRHHLSLGAGVDSAFASAIVRRGGAPGNPTSPFPVALLPALDSLFLKR